MGTGSGGRKLIGCLVVCSGSVGAFEGHVAGQHAGVGGFLEVGVMLWSKVGGYQWRGSAIGQGPPVKLGH